MSGAGPGMLALPILTLGCARVEAARQERVWARALTGEQWRVAAAGDENLLRPGHGLSEVELSEMGAHIQGEAVFCVAVGVVVAGTLQVQFQEGVKAITQPGAVDVGGFCPGPFRVGGEGGGAQGEAIG